MRDLQWSYHLRIMSLHLRIYLEAKPLQIELDDIHVEKISERSATIEIAFIISNPNPRSVIVQTMDYQLFATDYSDSEQISGGEIGSRPTGMVEFGSKLLYASWRECNNSQGYYYVERF